MGVSYIRAAKREPLGFGLISHARLLFLTASRDKKRETGGPISLL
jgi:hypothetical protein